MSKSINPMCRAGLGALWERDSWQEYVEYNIRHQQDHKTPGEIHTKSERLRDTFDSCFKRIDHGVSAL
jgi:hypothetical protein